MHGNEPTATGAVFDLLNFLKACPEASERFVERLHEDFTLLFVPMLNPDGAVLFRRSNALGIDPRKICFRHCLDVNDRQLRQIEVKQQAPDHPILWGVPETNYLKFFLFQVI